ncbi:hypothetical protein BRCON_0808 [Candidatus Sumerlaea chitinivorans]|uniref:Uncharacterized protein n=1 Tax=Sumerlaea chitinivorans TaxID=2250252 RepID=A0A2Z4Y576_SUMC1|nr:hypothetical protein BRCON_0808 [Candidatus Sumerlaea chitinivorans]
MRKTSRHLVLPRSKSSRGSAMVVTLILVGIMFFAVGVMLLHVRDLSRSTLNKVLYEEAYHTAMSGLAATRNWIREPALAKAHLGSTIGGKLEKITSGAIAFSNYVRANRDNTSLLDNLTVSQIVSYYTAFDASLGSGRILPDGRQVLYEFTGPDNKVIRFRNDALGNPTENLFSNSGNGARAYVTRIRITTPYRSSGTSAAGPYAKDDLRKVTLIIESEGQVIGEPRPKTRIVQQKILIIPGTDTNTPPLVGSTAGLMSGAIVTAGGTSSLNIHWGPVVSKGPINLLGLSPLSIPAKSGDPYELSAASNKFVGAGVGDEKWVKWISADRLYNKTGNNLTPIFPNTLNGVPVTDFFVQVLNGAFNSGAKPLTRGTLSLGGDYNWTGPGQWALPTTGERILFDPIPDGGAAYPMGSGALIQNWQPVAVTVDNMINNILDYESWKSFAIANNGYIRPRAGGGGFVNERGQTLHVTPSGTLTTVSTGNTPLTSLAQISMKRLIPPDGNTAAIPDRMLFIDTPEGRANGTPVTISLGSNDAFFWKGMIYHNGNWSTSGGGAFPTVLMKNPDEYAADPTGSSTGTRIANCYLDGLLYVTGSLSRTGNATIYGCIVTKNGYGGTGSPDIYYNSRLKAGLFSSVSVYGSLQIAEMVTGPIAELNAWL